MSIATEYKYIIKDQDILQSEPIIQGTRTPVRAVVENWRFGLSPEEIVTRMPHVTLAQVFEALSYYSDHQAEINEHIEKNQIPAEKIHPSLR